MKQIRLEALKLACHEDRSVDEIIETAEKFAQYVENGPTKPKRGRLSKGQKPREPFEI